MIPSLRHHLLLSVLAALPRAIMPALALKKVIWRCLAIFRLSLRRHVGLEGPFLALGHNLALINAFQGPSHGRVVLLPLVIL